MKPELESVILSTGLVGFDVLRSLSACRHFLYFLGTCWNGQIGGSQSKSKLVKLNFKWKLEAIQPSSSSSWIVIVLQTGITNLYDRHGECSEQW